MDLHELYMSVVKSKHNAENKHKYEHIYRYGYSVPVFRCCICGDHTTIIRSISNKGSNLICLRCRVKYFTSEAQAIRFVCGELELKKEGEYHEGR